MMMLLVASAIVAAVSLATLVFYVAVAAAEIRSCAGEVKGFVGRMEEHLEPAVVDLRVVAANLEKISGAVSAEKDRMRLLAEEVGIAAENVKTMRQIAGYAKLARDVANAGTVTGAVQLLMNMISNTRRKR